MISASNPTSDKVLKLLRSGVLKLGSSANTWPFLITRRSIGRSKLGGQVAGFVASLVTVCASLRKPGKFHGGGQTKDKSLRSRLDNLAFPIRRDQMEIFALTCAIVKTGSAC